MAEAGSSDNFAQVRGFRVEIDSAGGKDVDVAWESVAGGELCIECTDTTIGGDKFTTTSPGHKSVNSVTLRGAMTNKRAALCTWMNDTTSGKPWKRSMTVTELLSSGGSVKDGKSYTYFDGFPIRYKYPALSVTNTAGNVQEEIELKFLRMEMK